MSNGDLLPTDLAFLENEQRWVPISLLPKAGEDHLAEFNQKLKVETPAASVTSVMVAINVGLFIVMAIAGVSLQKPTTVSLIRWGADFGPLTTNGQWWRLLTAAFIHVGLLHIAFNMWALIKGGVFVERLYGHVGFLTVYLLSAIGGNLASVAWQPFSVAAGASGAILGVYGSLIGLLLARSQRIPDAAKSSLMVNALVLVGYTFLDGLQGASNIDVAAHLGGLVTGLIAGGGLAYRVDFSTAGGRLRRARLVAMLGVVVFSGVAWKLNKGNPGQAEGYLAEINGKSIVTDVNDTVIYSGKATAQDAMRLGRTLTTAGIFANRKASVLYNRGQSGSTVSLFFKEGALKGKAFESQANLLGWLISASTANPLKLRVLNRSREIKYERVFDSKAQ